MGGQRARSRVGLGWKPGICSLGLALEEGITSVGSPRVSTARIHRDPAAPRPLSPQIPFLYHFKALWEPFSLSPVAAISQTCF